METAIIGIFLAAYWVVGDFLAPEMCYTKVQEAPQEVWRWVECEDLKEVKNGNNLRSL